MDQFLNHIQQTWKTNYWTKRTVKSVKNFKNVQKKHCMEYEKNGKWNDNAYKIMLAKI